MTAPRLTVSVEVGDGAVMEEEVSLLDGLRDAVLYFLWTKGLPLGRYKYTAMVKAKGT